MSGSCISWATCKSALCSRYITMPVPHHLVFYRPDALPAAHPTVSKHWRQTNNNQNFKKLEIAENKKLSYRRGTARYVVSVEILTTATQQCKNYLHDKIVCKTQVDDLCDKLQWLNVGARRYYKLSWLTTAQFITLWTSTFLELSW